MAEHPRLWALALLGCVTLLATFGPVRLDVGSWRGDGAAARPEPDASLPDDRVLQRQEPGS